MSTLNSPKRRNNPLLILTQNLHIQSLRMCNRPWRRTVLVGPATGGPIRRISTWWTIRRALREPPNRACFGSGRKGGEMKIKIEPQDVTEPVEFTVMLHPDLVEKVKDFAASLTRRDDAGSSVDYVIGEVIRHYIPDVTKAAKPAKKSGRKAA
jgi:hypothetical protein